MFTSYFRFALRNLRYRKLRSWLTILGVVIGVAAIISLVMISVGLEDAIKEQFSMIGSNKMFIMPKGAIGTFGGKGLTTDDVDMLKGMSEFESVISYLILPSVKVKYKGVEKYVMLFAFDSKDANDWWDSYGIGFEDGRMFQEGDKNVIVFGYKAVDDLFDKKVRLRSKVSVEDEDFNVIGVVEEIGNSQDDNQLYVPLEYAREKFNKFSEVSAIEATVKPGLDIDTVVDKVERRLKRKRGDEAFDIMTPVDILKMMSDVLSIVRVVLVSIAAISLIVGAMGIMNSMYTNVMERTREVGIMKSIGARNSGILMVFLIEAGLIGLIGGVLGVVLGYLLSKFVEFLAFNAGFKLLSVRFNVYLMVFGLVFAFLVGIVAGYLPAKQAADLNVVDALRYD